MIDVNANYRIRKELAQHSLKCALNMLDSYCFFSGFFGRFNELRSKRLQKCAELLKKAIEKNF